MLEHDPNFSTKRYEGFVLLKVSSMFRMMLIPGGAVTFTTHIRNGSGESSKLVKSVKRRKELTYGLVSRGRSVVL